jgi:hypothetical protein
MEKNIEISDKLIEQGKEFLNTTYIEKQVIRSGCADHTKMTANIFHLYPKKEIYRSDEYFFKNGEYKPVTFESPLVFEMWAFNTVEKTKYYLGEKQSILKYTNTEIPEFICHSPSKNSVGFSYRATVSIAR